MDYQDKHTETIVECARTLRRIQETQIESILRVIQHELTIKFPSIADRDENGPVDWSVDIMNCSSDDEVLKTINRIDNIENKAWKCRHCGKDTYDVDIDYLFGYDHIECALNAEYIHEQHISTSDVESLKREFDNIVRTLKQLQETIAQLDNRTTKF